MAGKRLHGSLQGWRALTACAALWTLLSASPAHSAERAEAWQGPEGLLIVAGGDRLRGRLAASDKPAEIAWRSPAFVGPLRFPLTGIQGLKFDAPTTASHGGYRIELLGGDELHGDLVSIDKSAVVVQTKQGTLRVKRTAVASVSHLYRALRPRAKPLAVEKLVIEKAHVVLANRKVVYAELIGYNPRATAFSFQARNEAVTYSANEIAEIVLSDAGANHGPVGLEYADGTRLSGKLLRIDDGHVDLQSSVLVDVATLPLAGLRSIRATAAEAPPARRRGEAVLTVGEGRLHGRLVAAQPDSVQTCLAWQPSGSSTATAIRAGVAASVDFGPAILRAVTANEAGEDDRIFLRCGDVLTCKISSIDADEIALHVVGSAVKRVPNARIKAVELGPHSRRAIAEEKLARLLTVPRLQRDGPPTHVLSSPGDDYLRGRLIAVTEDRVVFDVGAARREFPRDRIASIIWLEARDRPEVQGTGAGMVQVTDADGLSVSLSAGKLDDGWIAGTNDLLGDCRFRLNDLGKLRVGPPRNGSQLAGSYQNWRLTNAVEPKAFAGDAAAAGEERAEASEWVGRPAPDFTLDLLDGSKFHLSHERGKVLVLDFWASWCAPCVKGLPEVAALIDDFDAEKVRIIAVNLQETRDDAARAVERLKLTVPVGLDHDGGVASSFGASSVPYTVVVDADGEIAHVFVGYGPRWVEELKEAIGGALAKQKP